jgi:glycolate oxidase FAD binding subunit
MADCLKPRDAREVEAAVAWAIAEGKALEIAGHGSKRAIGRPVQTDLTLDVSALSGVTLYEPEELVLSARAGTPIAEIETLAASRGQQLAFEPMNCAAILGGPVGRGTIGGVLACNLAGPRRIKAGAARDHFLGCAAVSGRGEAFKSGGRVVKNVTGYDLCKLLAGSWGTLAVMTEVTVKTLPRPETEQSLILRGLEPAAAIGVLGAAMGSACDVSGAAHLPAGVAGDLLPGLGGDSVTALRVEGFAVSVISRVATLTRQLRACGDPAAVDAEASRLFWLAVRDATPFACRPGAAPALWRVSTTPSRAAELAAGISAKTDARMLFDWAGGLVWLALAEPGEDAGARIVHGAVAEIGGHATLLRAPGPVRAALDVFSPLDTARAALTKRVKESFDPRRVLNPGRMWAGI